MNPPEENMDLDFNMNTRKKSSVNRKGENNNNNKERVIADESDIMSQEESYSPQVYNIYIYIYIYIYRC